MTYYVSPTGSDSNAGTLASPWATWQYSFNRLVSGDILYVRGGTYTPSQGSGGGRLYAVRMLSRNGTSGSHITISAYQSEVPILDCRNVSSNGAKAGLYINYCSYVDFVGLTVINCNESNVRLDGPADGWVLQDSTSYITMTRCIATRCGQGWYIGGGTNEIRLTNCDAYENADLEFGAVSSGGIGGYCDGFGVHNLGTTGHVYFENCRAWNNSDDGWDCSSSNGYITYKNCWAFENGHMSGAWTSDFHGHVGIQNIHGDGAGFKIGVVTGAKQSGVQRILQNCVAVNNDLAGFDESADYSAVVDMQLDNCIAYRNGLWPAWEGGYEPGFFFQQSAGSGIVTIRNCTSYANGRADNYRANVVRITNSWQVATTTVADFVSVDMSQLTATRRPDGGLPIMTALHLVSSSDLIGKGTTVAGNITDSEGKVWASPPSVGPFEYSYPSITAPTVTTTAITSIQQTTAVSGGNVTSDGGASVTARGVCWSTIQNPTITLTTKTSNGSGTGSFVSSITGLTANTQYYVRAYATNSMGTSYGPNIVFVTFPIAATLPTVTTTAVTAITSNTATSGGNVTADGGGTVTERGIVWSTTASPTVTTYLGKHINGQGLGSFLGNITALSPGTTYYVRAYATNSSGTAYGSVLTFITLSSSTIYYVAKDGSNSNPGTLASPFLTITYAISKMVGSDILYVRTGTYNEQLSLYGKSGTLANPTTISAYLGESPILDGGNTLNIAIAFANGISNVKITGLEIKSFLSHAIICNDGVTTISNITISNCIIRDIGRICDDGAIGRDGIYLYNTLNVIIENCILHDIGRNAPGENGCSPTTDYYKNHDHGIYVNAVNSLIIRNNTFYNIKKGWALHFYPGASSNIDVFNNTFDFGNIYSGAGSYGSHVIFGSNLTNVEFRNNIFSGQLNYSIFIYSGTYSNVVITNNLAYGGVGTIINGTYSGISLSNNLTNTNPLMIDEGTYDFRLNSNSPAIDAGINVGLNYSGSAPDIGAYEYVGVQIPLPTVTTTTVTVITSNTATSGGNVTNSGGATITARGICYSTTANPTTANSIVAGGTGTGVFTSNLTGLTPATTYYVRAYATNSVGTAYGNQVTFVTTTSITIPTVTTTAVTAIGTNIATSGGNVTSNGGSAVTVRGVVIGTSPLPTTSGYTTVDGSGNGIFTSVTAALTPSTLYYIRAYATNSVGTAYGNQLTFTTLSVATIPTLTTTPPSTILAYSCISGGTLISNGNSTIIRRGLVWATHTTPVVNGDSQIYEDLSTTPWSYQAGPFNASTTYYLRAFATNAIGTGYGNQYVFVTLADLPTVTINTVSAVTQTTSTITSTITVTGAYGIDAKGVCWSTSPTPTIANSHTTDTVSSPNYTSSITGLTAGTTYYVRAYATNVIGTSYSPANTFITDAAVFSYVACRSPHHYETVPITGLGYGALYNWWAIDFTSSFDNWFLPSKDELQLLYDVLSPGDLSLPQWTSSEIDATTAYMYYPNTNTFTAALKSANGWIRPVTYFESTTIYTLGSIGQIGLVFRVADLGGGWFAYYEMHPDGIYGASAIPWSNVTNSYLGTTLEDIDEGWSNSDEIILQGGHTSSAAQECLDITYIKKLIPDGWHVPTLSEYATLSSTAVSLYGGSPYAGVSLREDGTVHWVSDDYVYNLSGFTGVGNGYFQGTNFYNLRDAGYLVTSDDTGSTTAGKYSLSDNTQFDPGTTWPKSWGAAIRLIKDDDTDPGQFIDYDGNIYLTVKIGSQVWIKSNFKGTLFNNGSTVPLDLDFTTWSAAAVAHTPVMVYFNHDINNA